MGIVSRFLKKKTSGHAQSRRKAPGLKLREVKAGIKIDGVEDFGSVCGFDLDQCPCSERRGTMVPLLFGANRRRALDGCEVLWRMASDFPASKGWPNPKRFPVSMGDTEDVSASISPLTPTGREPRYPLVVSVSAMSPLYEPEDWDAWVDACAENGGDMPEIPNGGRQYAVAHISYLADGTIGKASLTLWDESRGVSYTFSAKGGPLSLTKVERNRPEDDGWKVVYKT